MDYDPGWPVCQVCGRRLHRYERAWVEYPGGLRGLAAIADLDRHARRGIARVWHEHCLAPEREHADPVTHPRRRPRSRPERRVRNGER